MPSLKPILLLLLTPILHAQTTLQTTLHTTARIVVVDVVVTGPDNKPVQNLPRSAFTLTEGKTPQRIAGFEEHKALTAKEAATFPPLPKLAPGVVTNFVPTPINTAVDVLLLDALNTPLKDQSYVRAQLLDYLSKARPGTSIAIFGLSTQLSMLQGFTSNPEVLKQAVRKQLGKTSVLLDDPQSGAPTESISDQLADLGSMDSGSVAASLQTFQNIQSAVQQQLRVKYTLDAMDSLARYLADLPGRKNLIWFSGSFPLNILPDTSGTSSNPFAGEASSEAEYRETVNLLARSQVAVYPIDARGLQTLPSLDVASSGGRYARNPTAGAFGADNGKFLDQNEAEHDTMHQMAHDTGGQAFFNTNGLADSVARAIDAGSSYYTLTYTPQDTNWRGDYRKIQVAVQPAGYTLAYRRGFYADDPDSASSAFAERPTRFSPEGHPAPDLAPMRKAMAHGAPGPTEIIFKARVLPASTTAEPTLATNNFLNAKKTSGPYRRLLIDFAADAHSIQFTSTPDAVQHAEVEFTALVYTQDGALVISALRQVTATLPPPSYSTILRTGFPMHLEISVPDNKTPYFLRLGVRDLNANHVGATELPVAAVKNLPPAPPSSTAQPAH